MNPVVIVSIAALLAVGCNQELEGTLELTSTLDLNTQKDGAVTVPAGSYRAKFEIEDEGQEVDFKIKDFDGDSDLKAEMKIVSGALPKQSGPFGISGESVGQPFDIQGELSTDVQYSPVQTAWESCYIRIQRCDGGVGYPMPDRYYPPSGICYLTEVPGTREIEYRVATTTISASADLIDLKSKQVIGTFSGTDSRRVNQVLRQGSCFATARFY